MRVEILSPQKLIFEGEASYVKLPGVDGTFEVLNNHAPLIAAINYSGEAELLTDKDERLTFPLQGGVVEVLNNKMIILTEASV